LPREADLIAGSGSLDYLADRALIEWLLSKAVDLREEPGAGQDGADVESVMRKVVAENAAVLQPARRRQLERTLLAEAGGLGALEHLLLDPSVSEVMVNGPDDVWVERDGVIEPTTVRFRSAVALREAIDRLLAAAGRRADEMNPMADARLPDGSRLNVVLPPLAGCGPTMTIRRFPHSGLALVDLVTFGTIGEGDAVALSDAVRTGSNILICGATGSGKSTTLAALAGEVAVTERLITIEDTAELQIRHPHVVSLETRPPGAGGHGGVTMRDLVRNALRMRPDRLIVGEVRGGEALDMIDALATGHTGSLCTVHASSAAGALERLEQLCLQARTGMSHEALRDRIRSVVDLVVMQERAPDGKRLVTSISRVEGWNLIELIDEAGAR
jgi:pilus assembly protein CpaF